MVKDFLCNFFNLKKNNNRRYTSCTFIEHGLQFNQDSVSICYQNSNIGGGFRNKPLIKNFKGGKLNIKEINNFKKKLIFDLKKGIIPKTCEGCIQLMFSDWEPFTGKVKKFNLDYWTKCNSHCIYCYTHDNKQFYNTQKTYNLLETLTDLKNKNLLGYNGYVNFGGGEVAQLEEFNDIIKIFNEYNYEIMIHTAAIDYLQVLEEGLSKGRITLVISVDAGTKEVHEKVKQVKTYERVWENVAKYAKFQRYPFQVKIKYIIIPNINDIEKEIQIWIEKSKNAGVNNIYLEIESCYFENNRNNIPEYIYNLFYFAKNEAIKNKLKFNLYERASHMMCENPKYKSDWMDFLNTK